MEYSGAVGSSRTIGPDFSIEDFCDIDLTRASLVFFVLWFQYGRQQRRLIILPHVYMWAGRLVIQFLDFKKVSQEGCNFLKFGHNGKFENLEIFFISIFAKFQEIGAQLGGEGEGR